MAPGALDPKIDKRHRAPDQIGMRQVELFVVGAAARSLKIVGAHVGMADAEVDRETQLRGPPMLVADPGGKCRVGGTAGMGVVEYPVGREPGSAVRPVAGPAGRRPAEGAAEIGR